MARMGERVNAILAMRASAMLHGKAGYGGEGPMQTERWGDRERSVAWTDSEP